MDGYYNKYIKTALFQGCKNRLYDFNPLRESERTVNSSWIPDKRKSTVPSMKLIPTLTNSKGNL